MRGSPIRRIGYERWLRNLAVGWAMRLIRECRTLEEKNDHPPRW
jgi:epoxyqueuosine reductase QueG